VDSLTIGRELRARRTAAGRTVASVAADAGLSVPYIANLENGRGNPTTTALTRLAEALGMRLAVTLVPDEPGQPGEAVPAPAPAIPASLVRLGRTARFRQAATVMSAALERDGGEFSGELVAALALLGQAMGRELAEADWWRLLDALLLIAAHPAASLLRSIRSWFLLGCGKTRERKSRRPLPGAPGLSGQPNAPRCRQIK
jgi:transcriptional regulator with XRE-family HTH domain